MAQALFWEKQFDFEGNFQNSHERPSAQSWIFNMCVLFIIHIKIHIGEKCLATKCNPLKNVGVVVCSHGVPSSYVVLARI